MTILKTTSFGQNVIISDAIGTPAAPGAYFGFANAGGTQVASTGPRYQVVNGNPNGTLSSPIGSLCINTATGMLFVNTNGATAWAPFAGGASTWTAIDFSAGPASVTVTPGASTPAGRGKLVIDLYLRHNNAAAGDALLTWNGDNTSGNYRWQQGGGDNNVAQGGEANTSAVVFSSNTGEPSMAFTHIEIPFYDNTAMEKMAYLYGLFARTNAGDQGMYIRNHKRTTAGSGALTDAISSVLVTAPGGFSFLNTCVGRWRID